MCAQYDVLHIFMGRREQEERQQKGKEKSIRNTQQFQQ